MRLLLRLSEELAEEIRTLSGPPSPALFKALDTALQNELEPDDDFELDNPKIRFVLEHPEVK